MGTPLKDRLARQASGLSLLSFDPTGRDEPQLATLPLHLIDPDPDQPRRDVGDVTDLALSIRSHGLLSPIIVEGTPDGRYRILAGERRFTACKSLGLPTIPCIVRTVEDQSRLALQLIENMQRQNLTPLEEAAGLRRLMDEFNLSQRDLALRIGKSPASVNQILRILDLDPTVLADLQTHGQPSKSVLLEIAKESDPDRQRELIAQSQDGSLTVRKAREHKPRPAAKPSRVVFEVEGGTVTLRFGVGESTKERVEAALREALEKATERSDV